MTDEPYRCGADTATTDAPCRNIVSGPDDYCWLHRDDEDDSADDGDDGSVDVDEIKNIMQGARVGYGGNIFFPEDSDEVDA